MTPATKDPERWGRAEETERRDRERQSERERERLDKKLWLCRIPAGLHPKQHYHSQMFPSRLLLGYPTSRPLLGEPNPSEILLHSCCLQLGSLHPSEQQKYFRYLVRVLRMMSHCAKAWVLRYGTVCVSFCVTLSSYQQNRLDKRLVSFHRLYFGKTAK